MCGSLALLDVTIVQGEPSQMDVALPAGYEMISASGPSLERTENRPDRVTLFVMDPAQRRHQFLISLERQNNGGSFKLETGFPTVVAARRETGEVAVEGVGTLEIAPATVPGLRRMDVREIDPALASATRQSLSAAFRYQRTADVPPTLTLDVRRFPDAAVLQAVAERAVATTLVTAEGHALTEITLWMRNRAQPFMKVALPEGASLLSVEVGGSPASPVEGKDGSRVPLLRPGYRPDGPYSVSFVYLHAGTPFAKKGDMQMMLPKMDVPVNVLEWELFVPDRYRVDRFNGNMLAADLFEHMTMTGTGQGIGSAFGPGMAGGLGGGIAVRPPMTALAGQIVGRIVDPTGAPVPGVTVTVVGGGQRQQVITDGSGTYATLGTPVRSTRCGESDVWIQERSPIGCVRSAPTAAGHDDGAWRNKRNGDRDRRGAGDRHPHVGHGLHDQDGRAAERRTGAGTSQSAPGGYHAVGQRAESAAACVRCAAGADGGAARGHVTSVPEAAGNRRGDGRVLSIQAAIGARVCLLYRDGGLRSTFAAMSGKSVKRPSTPRSRNCSNSDSPRPRYPAGRNSLSTRMVQMCTCKPAACARCTRSVGAPRLPSAPMGTIRRFSGPMPSA